MTSPLDLGSSFELSGSGFRGLSEASGTASSQNSPSDCPVVQLRSLESSQIQFLSSTNWSTNAFIGLPVTNFPPGWALATVFANGIPSAGSFLLVGPKPSLVILTNPIRLLDATFRFTFTNTPGALFTVLAATNPALSLSNWIDLGAPSEVSDGQFQFTDSQAAHYPERLYRVRSP